MPVVLVHEGVTQSSTKKQSASSRAARAAWSRRPTGWPVEGLLVHAAGQGENGFRVVDVWESEDAIRRFGDYLTPILQELGANAQPEVYPAHTFVSA